MAVTYWVGGGTDDKFGTADNWSNGVPGTGDVAVINDSAVDILAEDYATAFGELRIGSGFTGSIGVVPADGEVALSVTCDTVVIDTSANAYIDATATLVTIEKSAHGDDAIRLTGDVTTLRVLGARGTVVLGEAAALSVDDLEILGGRTAVVEIQSLTTLAAAPVSMDEGRLEIHGMAVAATGRFDLIGGHLDLYGGSFDTATMEVWGRFVVRDYRDTNSTIGTINVYSGTWNGTSATADTLTIGTLRLYDGAIFDERNGLLNYIYSNGVHFAGSGTFRAATSRKITEAS